MQRAGVPAPGSARVREGSPPRIVVSGGLRESWGDVERRGGVVADRSSERRSDVAVLRRRWPVILVAAVLGLGLGILYASLVPLQLTSRSKVLLSSGSSSGGDSSEAAIDTQIQILLSTPVLDKAGQALHPALSATQVMERIDVEAATSQLITIDAFSPRPHEARTLSQAIADAYVQTITDNMRAVNGAIVGDLRTRRDELNQQLKALLTQVHATKVRLDAEAAKSPAAVRDAQILAQLTASQGDIAKQLESVKGELAESGAVGTASTLASVVQPAAPAAGPGRVPGLVTWGAVGALLGGALAAALIALRARRDPRLRARDDMADAVGSSVLADVRSRRQRSVAEWLALFETYVASPVDAWAFRQLLRALATMTDAAPLSRSGGR